MKKVNEIFEKDQNASHVIVFKHDFETITCYGHSDESITEKVIMYYEKQHKINCCIYSRFGKIYK